MSCGVCASSVSAILVLDTDDLNDLHGIGWAVFMNSLIRGGRMMLMPHWLPKLLSKTSGHSLSWLFCVALCLLLNSASAQTAPNVIVIVSDDAGYADFGFMDGLSGTTSQIPTPNLDALAARGVKFSRSYISPVCQPSRAALVTGGYQNRIGNEFIGNNYYLASQGFAPDGVPEGVPADTITIFERMKSVGYSTTAIGKWHLGQTEETPTTAGNRPEHQGVDEFFGFWQGSRSYNVGVFNSQLGRLRRTVVDPNGVVTDTNEEGTFAGQNLTNVLGQLAVDYIGEHHDDPNPFFMYHSFTAPHTPMHNSPDFNDPRLAGLSGIQKQYGSMMLTMDKEIGRIVDALEDPDGDPNTDNSIADETLIVFINDNGGATNPSPTPNGSDNGFLRRGKSSMYEGGIRVPMIISGAGIDPNSEGTIYDGLVHAVDILPTAFAAGGGVFGPEEDSIDGVNLLPFINGEDASATHDVLVQRYGTEFAVVTQDWKLVWWGDQPAVTPELFNLATDVSETTNVAAANPTIVEELQRHLTDHEVEFDKPRFEELGDRSGLTINIFDRFAFNPGTVSATINWSDAGSWFEAGTSNVDTLLHTDAFAGAVLEFPTTDNISYVATNDMTRSTGLEFMLNKIVLNGQFAGTSNRSATINGNDLLFANDLDGAAPQIALEATSSGGHNFSYSIDMNLVMYDDLTIGGNGNAELTIKGKIRDYFSPRNLRKSGTSTVYLEGNNTFAGSTVIEEGTLALLGNASLDNASQIEVSAGAEFDVTGTTSGGYALASNQTLLGSGTVLGDIAVVSGAIVAPGPLFGDLSVDGSVSLEPGSRIEIDLGPGALAGTDYDLLDVSGVLDLLGGELAISLEAGFMPSLGDSFEIFNFTSFTGDFDSYDLPMLASGLTWDIDSLFSSGGILQVVADGTGGDFNADGRIDALDFLKWQREDGSSAALAAWEAQYLAGSSAGELASAVPEPSSFALLSCLLIVSTRRAFARESFAR